MKIDLLEALRSGYEKLARNPQLWYTILVAVAILIAFIFVANRFVVIAQDAQNRLVDIRLGSFQDSFVEFAPDYLDTETDMEELDQMIQKIAFRNPSIQAFKVVKFDQDDPIVVASLDSSELGSSDTQNEFVYNLARTNPDNSFRLEKFENGVRVFQTTRIITNNYNDPIGAVVTEQSLTEADLKINENIRNSVVVFVIIVILIMFLFFRHARIIDYATLYKRLREVDELKDDFISMASHELRTPLTVIRGYAENLSETANVSPEAKKSVERIDIATRQLDELVADMLDVSRIEQGRMKFEPKLLNPVPLLAEVIDNYKIVANDKGLALNFTHALRGGEKISADPMRLKQVMINLIGNAIKYTPKGEINVKVKSERDKVVIRVSDTGLGMTAEESAKLFQKFYRIEAEETREIKGTGLGLWITKQIVELMKGKISVESIKGVGTHFIVEFPVSRV